MIFDYPFESAVLPTFCDQPHRHSPDQPIPGSSLVRAGDPVVQAQGEWCSGRLRGTATRFLHTQDPKASLEIPFSGRALSLLRPISFAAPKPYHRPWVGAFRIRIDHGDWRLFDNTGGRELLIEGQLSDGPHLARIEAEGQGPWALEGLRVWQEAPAVVSGTMAGGPMLMDVRAAISDDRGRPLFSRSVHNPLTGRYSLLLPAGRRVGIEFHALGWHRHRIDALITPAAGAQLDLPIRLERLGVEAEPPTRLAAGETLRLVCFSHLNTWGQECAEWLARRVPWINGFQPHAVLAANEVNSAYLAGALRGLSAPWLTTGGNHSVDGFAEDLQGRHLDLAFDGVRIVSTGAGRRVGDWSAVLDRFRPQDRVRIVCAFDDELADELLAKARVRLLFHGHGGMVKRDGVWIDVRPAYELRGETVVLRKLCSNSLFTVAIHPPYDSPAAVQVERFVFPRES